MVLLTVEIKVIFNILCIFYFSYNGERLNNSLKRVKKFSNWREPIPEAYYPKLDSLTSSRGWPPRQAGMRWQNINRPVDGINITIDQMEEWRRRLEDAVSTGRVRLVSFRLSIQGFHGTNRESLPSIF